ncbi:MAG: PQQ-dependent sugar dehydrogenase [Nitrososphaeraceae archaeon]
MKRNVSLAILVGVSVLIGVLITIFSSTNLNSLFAFIKRNPSLVFPNDHLKVHTIVDTLSSPTGMAFIDNNSMLVLERSGNVRLVSDGILHDKPVLKVSVNTEGERGLLGIATTFDMQLENYGELGMNSEPASKYSNQKSDFVFLYFTEAQDNEPLRNRIYRYEWNGHDLINPLLILDLPASPGPYHDGGKLVIGPDNCLYAVIGDLNSVAGPLQNLRKTGNQYNDTSVILRVPLDNASYNKVFSTDIGSKNSQYHLAYGIRNSFGLAFDPLTDNLWDTENGEDKYDEINLVKPGFNSGWYKITGPISRTNLSENELVRFNGSSYSDPEFSWYMPIGVTDIEFLNSDKLGDKYENNIFVGDINNGKIYFFELDENRTGFKISDGHNSDGGIGDLVADNDDEASKVTFGNGFDRITDIETGPDGLLYILSYDGGRVYRVTQ